MLILNIQSLILVEEKREVIPPLSLPGFARHPDVLRVVKKMQEGYTGYSCAIIHTHLKER